jgi:hypothetical protein
LLHLVLLNGPEKLLERVSKIPPERDPEASEIEERVVDGE